MLNPDLPPSFTLLQCWGKIQWIRRLFNSLVEGFLQNGVKFADREVLFLNFVLFSIWLL